MSICIACRCTDQRACPGGCSWVYVDEAAGIGLCSVCERRLATPELRRETKIMFITKVLGHRANVLTAAFPDLDIADGLTAISRLLCFAVAEKSIPGHEMRALEALIEHQRAGVMIAARQIAMQRTLEHGKAH